MKNKIIVILVIVALLPLFWIIDGVPYTIDVTAKIYPARKWVLLKDTDGSLTSTLYNYKDGVVNNVRSYKLDNGDVAHVELLLQSSSAFLREGDSVAVLHSALIDERIGLVKSQLEELRAYLRVDQTGLKVSEVEQATEQLNYARQQLGLETRNYSRAKVLFSKGAIAQAEYQSVKTAYALALSQVKIAKKALESARTGVKPEQEKYSLSKVETAEKELATLMRQKESYTLLAPISGKADFNVTPEEVMTIEDTSAYILHFPVKLADKVFVTSLSKISVVYPAGSEPMQGMLADLSDKVEYMAGEQLVFAKAVLPEKASEVSPGMFLRCQVECDRISLAEYIQRILKQSMK